MEIKEMTINDIEARAKEIREAMKAEDADLDALTAEVDALEARKAEIRAEVETRAKKAEQVAKGLVGKTKEKHEEKNKMNLQELRKSHEYACAYANYIKTGRPDECRALLAQVEERDALLTVNGTVPVPASVEGKVRTAWERDGIMSRVGKTYFKGNHKVFYEISGTDAVVHTEGGEPVDAEELLLGSVTMIPQMIKKWLPISDEVYDLTGEEFLDYIYDELTYRIVKKLSGLILADIQALATSHGNPAVSAVPATELSLDTIAQALATLSDDAADPALIMSRQTWAQFEALRAAANYAFDPYYGMPIIYNDTLTNSVIVGDLGEGALVNFPNGDEVKFKFDDKTEMTSDIIRILGKLFAAHAVVSPHAFAVIEVGGGDTA